MVEYLCKVVEQMIDDICKKVPSIPTSIRAFCKGLHDKTLNTQLSYNLISKFLMQNWLVKTAL